MITRKRLPTFYKGTIDHNGPTQIIRQVSVSSIHPVFLLASWSEILFDFSRSRSLWSISLAFSRSWFNYLFGFLLLLGFANKVLVWLTRFLLSSATATCVSSECCALIITARVATVAMRAVKQIIGDGQKSACSRKFLNQSTVIEQPAWLIHRMTKMTTQSTGHVRNIAKYCGFVEK